MQISMKQLLSLLLPFAALTASAATIDIVATTRGLVLSGQAPVVGATSSFIVGNLDGTEYRDVFQFDLPVINGTLTSAMLIFSGLPSDHYLADNGETVHVEAHALSGPFGTNTFAAIGTGHNYGGVDVASSVALLTITLDGTALGTISGSTTFFAGGIVTSPSPLSDFLDERAFGNTTSANNVVTLELQVDAAGGGGGGGGNAPEPQSVLLMAGGLAAIIVTRLARKG